MAAQPINDINLTRWRDEMANLNLDSLWLFDGRDKGQGHALTYYGNFIPQVPRQLMLRYTRANDIVLDPFIGSGTTSIEARNLGRRSIGIDLKGELVADLAAKLDYPQHQFIQGDSTQPEPYTVVRNVLAGMEAEAVQLSILHPPYFDIIQFSEDERDLSNAVSLDAFLHGLYLTLTNIRPLMEKGRYLAIVIGDIVGDGKYVPLAFKAMEAAQMVGFELRQIIVKNMEGNERGKGKNSNLWRYRCMKNGTYLFKHEYVLIFRR